MDDFDSFVTHAKMNALQLGPSVVSGDALSQNSDANMADASEPRATSSLSQALEGRTLVLVDDLPHAQGAVQRKRLVQALREPAHVNISNLHDVFGLHRTNISYSCIFCPHVYMCNAHDACRAAHVSSCQSAHLEKAVYTRQQAAHDSSAASVLMLHQCC